MTLPDAAAQPGAGAREDVVDVSTIRSKVQAPPVRASTLERPRLLEWLADHATDRIKVIAADAGYGKTTLLADFARRTSARCLWYRLEPNDGDWVTWINYLIAAVREIVPDFAQPTASLLGQMAVLNPSREIVLGSLMSELASIDDAPTMLILDDFHLVDDREDVHAILGRLFERAPPNLTFIISSRRVPELRLGRFVVAGEVAQLGTEDLRFSRDETAELFAVAYGHPLEPDLVGEVDARAEGWGASLQLVDAAIRNRPPSEARAFIHSLSGAEGRLYDYLAEEVLSGLDDPMRQVLVHASLLERVVPEFVAAALSAGGEAPRGDVSACLSRADDLGLMGRSTPGSRSRRIHPLLHDFLARHLAAATTLDERCRMHLSVARVAEPQDWLTACHHFIEGGQPQQAMRVLSASATRALGSGAWGAADSLVHRMPDLVQPVAVLAVRARALIAIGRAATALGVLTALDDESLPPVDRAIVRLTMAGAHHELGNEADLARLVDLMIEDGETPGEMKEIAAAWRLMLAAANGGELREASAALIRLAERQRAAGFHYFSGISFHNAMGSELTRGLYRSAMQLGDSALAEFNQLEASPPELASTHATIAVCAAELGLWEMAAGAKHEALAVENAPADAYADCAYVAAACGDTDEAAALLAEAKVAARRAILDPGAMGAVDNAEAMLLLAEADVSRAHARLPPLWATGPDPDLRVKRFMLQAVIATALEQDDALILADEALRTSRRQGAGRYETRLEVVQAAAARDSVSLRRALERVDRAGALGLLEVANAVGSVLYLFESLPPSLELSMSQRMHRWLPILRKQVSTGNTASGRAAAVLVSRFGSLADAPLLAAFEQTYMRHSRPRRLTRALVKRTSPVLVVHDLGRTQCEVGGRAVLLSETRRKAATLLMYLITRPSMTAVKEQVLDELWPDLDPAAATNSLNQTLYFLRRDIDPWYDDGVSVEYVVNEGELMWLDADIVNADSIRFLREAVQAATSKDPATVGATICDSYCGRFAPEFEYEQWAIAWRDRVHGAYLHLVHSTQARLARLGNLEGALRLLLAATAIDPEALDLEVAVVWTYARLGAAAAAAEQYGRLCVAYRRDLGLDPPSFADVVGSTPQE